MTQAEHLIDRMLEEARGAECVTCSFQSECVVLVHMLLARRPRIPVLFLDTGYHFAETYSYRDRLAAEWNLNLMNLQPALSVEQQESRFGVLYGSAPDRCCGMRKVEPLFAALENYRTWFTGLRREQSKSRTELKPMDDFRLPSGTHLRKVSPLAEWSAREVWQYMQSNAIPELPLYRQGYTSIGCQPCTSLPLDPEDSRSGRWSGKSWSAGSISRADGAMEVLLGFVIAVLIGLTGVGGGVITAPVLTLFMGVPPVESVGTALLFTAVVKLAAAPVYVMRRQVDFRVLGLLLLGGLPGVIAGSLLLAGLKNSRSNGFFLAFLGTTIIAMAALNLYRLWRPRRDQKRRERLGLLPWIAAPIGAEVGFSSAGAGALGSLVLMSLTAIPASQIVGTDVVFGLGLSLAGGGISLATGNYHSALMLKMCIGGLAGALVGANLLAYLPARLVRVALCLWLVSVGGQLFWRAVAP